MKGLLMMFKSMGIEIDPAEIERLRVGVPRLIIDVQTAVKNFDERLKTIEQALSELEHKTDFLVSCHGETVGVLHDTRRN
jgi:hypothetical protein